VYSRLRFVFFLRSSLFGWSFRVMVTSLLGGILKSAMSVPRGRGWAVVHSSSSPWGCQGGSRRGFCSSWLLATDRSDSRHFLLHSVDKQGRQGERASCLASFAACLVSKPALESLLNWRSRPGGTLSPFLFKPRSKPRSKPPSPEVTSTRTTGNMLVWLVLRVDASISLESSAFSPCNAIVPLLRKIGSYLHSSCSRSPAGAHLCPRRSHSPEIT
jgi:hypothetical protein